MVFAQQFVIEQSDQESQNDNNQQMIVDMGVKEDMHDSDSLSEEPPSDDENEKMTLDINEDDDDKLRINIQSVKPIVVVSNVDESPEYNKPTKNWVSIYNDK